ncbi:hypothetical protein GCM10027040_27610 [Halomonas shantousis]
MAEIDKHSDTWRAVTEWARQQRQEAIDMLIADRDSEQQRGKIELIDELLKLTKEASIPPVVADNYR